MATDLRRRTAVLDSRSFDRFYRRHQGEIYRYVLQDVGNRADAEEVTQTAFLDAYRALRRGHEPEMPRAWMYGIARNAARRRFRTLSRRPREVELDPAVVEGLAKAQDDPWAEAVRSAFSKLKASHREVLFLREIEGLTYEEIGDRLRLSHSAVETLLFRARRSLRERLEAEGVRPAVAPRRRTSLKGLALLPAAFLGRLSDRMQQLVSPEIATKAAGAVTAVALGTGIAVATQSLPLRAAPPNENATRPALGSAAGSEFVPGWLVRGAPLAGAQPANPDRREGDRKRNDDRRGDSGKPNGEGDQGRPNEGGGSGSASSGGALEVDGGGGSVTTPQISVPAIESSPLPDAPVSSPAPPVETPAVEAPPVETPPVEVPPVEVELPPDTGGLLDD